MENIRPDEIKVPGIFIPFEQPADNPDLFTERLHNNLHNKLQELGELGVHLYQVTPGNFVEEELDKSNESERQLGKQSVAEFYHELENVSTTQIASRWINTLQRTHTSAITTLKRWESSAEKRARLEALEQAFEEGNENPENLVERLNLRNELGQEYGFDIWFKKAAPEDFEQPIFFALDGKTPFDKSLRSDETSYDEALIDLDNLAAYVLAGAFGGPQVDYGRRFNYYGVNIGPKMRTALNKVLNAKMNTSDSN